MKTLTLLAFLSVTFMGALMPHAELVDCFYEINVSHPDCKKQPGTRSALP